MSKVKNQHDLTPEQHATARMRRVLRQQILQNESQNDLIRTMSNQLGKAGNILEKIKTLHAEVGDEGVNFEEFYDGVTSLLEDFDKSALRTGGYRAKKKSEKDIDGEMEKVDRYVDEVRKPK